MPDVKDYKSGLSDLEKEIINSSRGQVPYLTGVLEGIFRGLALADKYINIVDVDGKPEIVSAIPLSRIKEYALMTEQQFKEELK